MKKIMNSIKLLMKTYKRYRLIITNDIIELKLTPKSNSDNEINYVVENNKYGKERLIINLQNLAIIHETTNTTIKD